MTRCTTRISALTMWVALTLTTSAAWAADALPADVLAFAQRQASCYHFRGEEGYNAARRRELSRAVHKYCDGADRIEADLRAKYQDKPAVLDALRKAALPD
ncbi:hypothetical protein os4_11090 [Comamonadaceae bacterium OS-4]|nr:hypothetical protein os4_11090 [Comamonadaceae bacterium OS-4]